MPKERIDHKVNLKQVQIQRFSSDAINDASDEDLRLQYIALRDLVNDKYKNYYKLDDKLLKPKGNPEYYSRLMSELKGEKKESFFTAIRTVIFGK